MGFHRQRQPDAPFAARAAVTDAVSRLLSEEVAFEARTQDPFLVENGCINPAGHFPIASCGEVVCAHCAAIFWR